MTGKTTNCPSCGGRIVILPPPVLKAAAVPVRTPDKVGVSTEPTTPQATPAGATPSATNQAASEYLDANGEGPPWAQIVIGLDLAATQSLGWWLLRVHKCEVK